MKGRPPRPNGYGVELRHVGSQRVAAACPRPWGGAAQRGAEGRPPRQGTQHTRPASGAQARQAPGRRA
eukprot:2488809-Prymnesium_polylepis.1